LRVCMLWSGLDGFTVSWDGYGLPGVYGMAVDSFEWADFSDLLTMRTFSPRLQRYDAWISLIYSWVLCMEFVHRFDDDLESF